METAIGHVGYKVKDCYGKLQMNAIIKADLPLKNLQTIIFDLDGTLIDSVPDLCAALNRLLSDHHRRAVSLDEVKKMVGNGARKLVERGFRATGTAAAESDLDELTKAFLAHYDGHETDETKLYPGTVSLLQSLKTRGYKLALCTNKPQKPSENILKAFDLDRFFDCVLGGDILPLRKPAPDMIDWVLEKLATQPDHALMVGDSANDIDAAKAAKVKSVAVSFGYSKIAPSELGADVLINHLDELDQLLN